MLFADQLADAGQAVDWFGRVAVFVLTAVSGFFAWKGNRDRLQFDSDKQRQGWQIEQLVAEAVRAKAVEQKLVTDVQAAKKEAEAAKGSHAECEDKLSRAEVSLARQQAKLDATIDWLALVKGMPRPDAGPHDAPAGA